MKRSFRKLLVLGIIIPVFSSCTLFQSSAERDVIVAEVAGVPITITELKANFYNSPTAMAPVEEEETALIEFLTLYADYKVKLAAGRDAGYFDSPEIVAELENYENQSAVPFWLEKRVRDELLEELYERAKYEIKASHILIQLSDQASPSDTLRAYQRLMEARERYLGGEDFLALSEEYSTRQRTQSMGGQLNFFSAGWSVKPFEDVAYATEVGEVSMPFRTSFGYHIVRVEDRRPTQPERMLSHIFFATRGGDNTPDSAMERANEAFELLNEGMSWDDVVTNYTEDRQSANTGGRIGWVNSSRYSAEFTDFVFGITETGVPKGPVETDYGVHIFRLDSIRTFPTKEEHMSHLYERLRQLPRYRQNQAAVLHAVKRAGNARVHQENLRTLEGFLDVNPQLDFLSQDWNSNPDLLSLPLYTINSVDYTIDDFRSWLFGELEMSDRKRYRFQHVNQFADFATQQQLTDITRREFDEFARLSREYHNGLVVFSITEDSVWNYAGRNQRALQDLYRNNPDDYWFERRFRYVRVAAMADSTLHQVKTAVGNGLPIDSLRSEFQGLIVRRDVINSLESFPFSQMEGLSEGEFSEIFEYRRRQTMYYLEEILEPRPMTFEEAFNKLVATYQPIREEEWMQRMRSKYSVHLWPERITEYLQNN